MNIVSDTIKLDFVNKEKTIRWKIPSNTPTSINTGYEITSRPRVI